MRKGFLYIFFHIPTVFFNLVRILEKLFLLSIFVYKNNNIYAIFEDLIKEVAQWSQLLKKSQNKLYREKLQTEAETA